MRNRFRTFLNEAGFLGATFYVLSYPWLSLSQSAFLV